VTTVAILQARMTSTRLPGKVLMDLEGSPMIEHELDALGRARSLDGIVLATSENVTDDPLIELADRLGIRWFRGSEHDVLGRYAGATRAAGADAVVRVTGDCPLLDPDVVDRVVGALDREADYASNVLERTFPVGLDVEALHADVLLRLHRLARSPEAREHVTWFLREERPELFVRRSVVDEEDNSDLRLAVDTREDLEAVRGLARGLRLGDRSVSYRDVVAFAREHGIAGGG